MCKRFLTLFTLCVSALPVLAADDDGPVYLTPAEAGPDYLVQGEYLGDVEAENGRGPLGCPGHRAG